LIIILKEYQWLNKETLDCLYNLQETKEKKSGIIIKIREAIKNNDIRSHLSFRTIINFAKGIKTFGWHKF
jgi:hypothetical protein